MNEGTLVPATDAAPPVAPARRYTVAQYLILNLLFVVTVLVAANITNAVNPRELYVCLLFPVCSLPLALADRLNGRYVLLAAMLAVYFLLYGATDVATLMTGAKPSESIGMLSPAELLILTGGVLLTLGYLLAVSRPRRSTTAPQAAKDWTLGAVVSTGLLLWAIGTVATWIWQVEFFQTTGAGTKVNEAFGPLSAFLLVLARLVQPLGTLLLAYGLAVSRNRTLLWVLLVTLAVQVVVGFVGDSKETALRGGVLVIFTLTLVNGRLPWAWLIGAVIFVLVMFPVFEGYRSVMGLRGMSREQGAQDVWHAFELAFEAREKVVQGVSEDYQNPSILERSNIKPNIELLVAKTGTEVKFQNGYTLALMAIAVVPRALWPDKPDISAGQLFNREFHISEDPNTYISVSFLGDLYWNFGWGGVVCGMSAIGLLLGSVNRRWDLSERRSVLRLLVIASTIYSFCARFESNLSLECIVWLRTLAAIGVIDRVLSRATVAAPAQSEAPVAAPALQRLEPASLPQPRFPNLMR